MLKYLAAYGAIVVSILTVDFVWYGRSHAHTSLVTTPF